MKYLSNAIVFFSLLIAHNTYAQTIDSAGLAQTIQAQAKDMGDLLLKKDFKSFTKYVHPTVIELIGGKEQMITLLEESVKEMEGQGTSFMGITFGVPSKIIKVDKELQCTMPQTIEMQMPDGRMVTRSTLIAVSQDQGKHWYFIDTGGKDIKMMQEFLPGLSSELVIPEKQEPEMFKK